jgi:hypothetical protein
LITDDYLSLIFLTNYHPSFMVALVGAAGSLWPGFFPPYTFFGPEDNKDVDQRKTGCLDLGVLLWLPSVADLICFF